MLPNEGNQRKKSRINLSTLASTGSSENYVTELRSNDILLGRGAPIVNYEGNVRFRTLVNTRKSEYNGTSRHQIKDAIARQIVLEIEQRGGRFLKRIESREEKRQLAIPDGQEAWVVVGDDVIMEKVKQALRDKEPVGGSPIPQPQYHHHAIPQHDLSRMIHQNRSHPSLSVIISSQDSLRPQSAPSTLLSTSIPYSLNQQQHTNSIPANAATAAAPGTITHSFSENDILHRLQRQLYPDLSSQQQPINHSNLLSQHSHQSNVTAQIPNTIMPSDGTNAYLRLLLQQQHNSNIPGNVAAITRIPESSNIHQQHHETAVATVASSLQQQQTNQILLAQINNLAQSNSNRPNDTALSFGPLTSSVLPQQTGNQNNNSHFIQQQLDNTLRALHRQNQQLLSDIIQTNPSLVGLPALQNVLQSGIQPQNPILHQPQLQQRSLGNLRLQQEPSFSIPTAENLHRLQNWNSNNILTAPLTTIQLDEHTDTAYNSQRQQSSFASPESKSQDNFNRSTNNSSIDRKRKARAEESESSQSSSSTDTEVGSK